MYNKYVTLVEQTLVEQTEDLSKSPAGKLAEEMKKAILSVFPKSNVYGGFHRGLGESIFLTFTLGKDKTEFTNGIEHNDPARTIFYVGGKFDRQGNILSDKLTLELSSGGSFSTNPDPIKDKYMAMGRHKVPFRKTTGDSKKMVVAIKKWFEKLKTELKANESNIYNYTLKGKF